MMFMPIGNCWQRYHLVGTTDEVLVNWRSLMSMLYCREDRYNCSNRYTHFQKSQQKKKEGWAKGRNTGKGESDRNFRQGHTCAIVLLVRRQLSCRSVGAGLEASDRWVLVLRHPILVLLADASLGYSRDLGTWKAWSKEHRTTNLLCWRSHRIVLKCQAVGWMSQGLGHGDWNTFRWDPNLLERHPGVTAVLPRLDTAIRLIRWQPCHGLACLDPAWIRLPVCPGVF